MHARRRPVTNSPTSIVIDGTLDFEDVLPDHLFKFMADRYWVTVFPGELARFDSWCMCLFEPMPVMNKSMSWRRPTWEECLDFVRLPIDRPDLVDAQKEAVAYYRKYAVKWVWVESSHGRFPKVASR